MSVIGTFNGASIIELPGGVTGTSAILKATATYHLRLAARGIPTESLPVEFADDAAHLLSR